MCSSATLKALPQRWLHQSGFTQGSWSVCRVCPGVLAARLWQSRLEASVQTLQGSSASLWGPGTKIPSVHTLPGQGTESWHQGPCPPLHCPQTPTAKVFAQQRVARGAAPAPPQCQLLPSLPHLGHIFLTIERAAKKTTPNCAPFPGWENILSHCLPSTPLLITANSCSLFSFCPCSFHYSLIPF